MPNFIIKVANNLETTVGGYEKREVTGKRETVIKDNDFHTVEGDSHVIDVTAGNQRINVGKGNQEIYVFEGDQTVSVNTGKRNLSVKGLVTEKFDGGHTKFLTGSYNYKHRGENKHYHRGDNTYTHIGNYNLKQTGNYSCKHRGDDKRYHRGDNIYTHKGNYNLKQTGNYDADITGKWNTTVSGQAHFKASGKLILESPVKVETITPHAWKKEWHTESLIGFDLKIVGGSCAIVDYDEKNAGTTYSNAVVKADDFIEKWENGVCKFSNGATQNDSNATKIEKSVSGLAMNGIDIQL